MPKTVSGLVAIAALAFCAFARADTVASVIAVSQPVWLHQAALESELDRSNDISIDDRIVTGVDGRAAIALWSDVKLRLYPESEIRISRLDNSSDKTTAELFLQRGRLCLQSGPPTSTGRNFKLNIASSLLATIHQSAHICVLRRQGQIALGLLSGSVQLSNTIEPAIVILSEPGFEFQLADDGSYELLPPGSSGSIASIDERPFISVSTRRDSGNVSKITSASETVETEVAVPAESTATHADADADATDDTAYVYTVYLFSTRSQEVADEVNQKLQLAGHDTRILASADLPTRYRIVAPGFTSAGAAREFSNSIVGTHGITGTWIGRDSVGDTMYSDTAPESAGTTTSETAATDAAGEAVEPGTLSDSAAAVSVDDDAGSYVYTVYLFSTRSKEVADEVNQELQQAGHDTRIIASSAGTSTRYRIVVSGFTSHRAAREYSDSIVGTHGISDTWIGRDRP